MSIALIGSEHYCSRRSNVYERLIINNARKRAIEFAANRQRALDFIFIPQPCEACGFEACQCSRETGD